MADTFSIDCFVGESSFMYVINSEKQNKNSSVLLFQFIPSNFDGSDSVLWSPKPTSNLSVVLSSCKVLSSCDGGCSLTSCCSTLLILVSNSVEFEFHFLKLNFPSAMKLLAFTYRVKCLFNSVLPSYQVVNIQ